MGAQNTKNSFKKTFKNGFQKKTISGSSGVFWPEENGVREGGRGKGNPFPEGRKEGYRSSLAS